MARTQTRTRTKKKTQSRKRRAAGPDRLVELDPGLEPYREHLAARQQRFDDAVAALEKQGGLLGPVSQRHRYLGFTRGERDGAPGWWYREWAPGAKALHLIGDLNGWDRGADPLEADEAGIWHRFLPDGPEGPALGHESRVKVHVTGADGSARDRIPALIRRAVPDPAGGHYVGQIWDPPAPHVWQHGRPPAPKGGLRVYEAHVGIAPEEGRVGTFDEFAEHVVPRIAALGYNAVQLMAIMEHPFYATAGYQVSNFFAVSSRFGTPEELKRLIDVCHGKGIRVILDLVHSHAVKNVDEGLNDLDGSGAQYFHAGERGYHEKWDSLCFDYGKDEVQRFLLSNARYWLEDVGFDGFRFDGVTSMLYRDHGLDRTFSGYDDYFGDEVDPDGLLYLTLANALAHAVEPSAVTLAEDVSGMPGIARPPEEGGLGFDYRLAMGVPDFWIRQVEHVPDEQWDLGHMAHVLRDRRPGEKHVGYAESHDQAMVGDQTLAFRLMGTHMYGAMHVAAGDLVVDRGVALHKMIRLITFALAGEGYLNFMGNEFGHPEWIDFPRPGNDDSFAYARRQWSLAAREDLRYKGLWRFDRAMMELDETYRVLERPEIEELLRHEPEKQVVFRRGPLILAFNFHPHESYTGMRVPVPEPRDYRLVVDTDAEIYDGHGRAEFPMTYPVQTEPMYGRDQSIQIYLPARSAQVLAPV